MPRQIIRATRALLPDGWRDQVDVVIGDDGRIESVGASGTSDPTHRVETLVPAPANVHSHTFQRAMAGLAERSQSGHKDSFWGWRRVLYRFLQALTPDDLEDIAALAFCEMLEAGFASVGEFHYVHHGPGGQHYDDIAELSTRIFAAAQTTGIGVTHLPVLYRFGSMRAEPLEPHQQRFGCEPDDFERLFRRCEQLTLQASPDTSLGVAPHSLRAVEPADLEACSALAAGRPLHLHIAEQPAEIEQSLEALGDRPLRWLLDHHTVDERWCLIHATHVEADEVRRTAKSGATVGLCPLTEANLGDGLFPLGDYLAAGGRFGVGTDSNVRISLRGELEMLEYGQRLQTGERNVVSKEGSSGDALLQHSATASAAIGREGGAIEAGRWADLLEIAEPNEGDGARLDPLSRWIFSDQLDVHRVWSAGRLVVEHGVHRDGERLRRRFSRLQRRLEREL